MERFELWMHLHQLAVAFKDAGATRDDRLNFAFQRLQGMPPAVRRELASEVQTLAADFVALASLMHEDK